MNTAALRASLREALIEYRAKRPKLSMRAIARNSGVNRYFLSKILDESAEGDAAPLDLNQVLLFLKFITKKDTVREIMEASSSEVQQLLSAVFHAPYHDSVVKDSSSPQLNLYDFNTYFILHFAAFHNGFGKADAIRILGESSAKTLANLVEKGLIREQGRRIYIVEQQDFTYEPGVMKHQLGNYSRFFDPTHIGEKRNFISVVSQCINRDTLRQIQEIYVEAYNKVDALLRDEANRGDIPAFAVSCVDSFTDAIGEEDGEEGN